MATTLDNGPILRWVKNEKGTPAHILDYPEGGTSQTFASGDLVIYDISDNGVVAISDSSGVPSAQTFLGIARTAATGVAGTLISVLIPSPNDIFSCGYASAEDTFVAPALDQVGKLVGLIQMNAGNNAGFAADSGNTNWARIERVDPQDITKRGGTPSSDPTMSTGDKVHVKFLTAVLDATGAQS